MSVEESGDFADAERTEERVTKAGKTTYVQAAKRGKHEWWRYLLGMLVILVVWVGLGGVASRLVALALGGPEGPAALRRLDFAAFGPVGGFVLTMTAFPFLLAGILIAVVWVHRRHPRTLVTARGRISLRRIGQGFVAWFVAWCLVLGLGQYLLYPGAYYFDFSLAAVVAFVLFVPLALVLTFVQTTTEELFYRGYLVQGASVIWANRVFLALVSATLFTLPHLLNPEAQSGGWLTVLIGYFVAGGLLWAVVSLVDGTTELAIGAHFAHNICSVLVVNHTGTLFTTPALIRVGQYDATFPTELFLLIMILLFLAFVRLGFGRDASTPGPTATEPLESS